jgi:hypothetical protein
MVLSKFDFGPDPTLHFKGMLAHSERPQKSSTDFLFGDECKASHRSVSLKKSLA